jgi:hypothetical protein
MWLVIFYKNIYMKIFHIRLWGVRRVILQLWKKNLARFEVQKAEI